MATLRKNTKCHPKDTQLKLEASYKCKDTNYSNSNLSFSLFSIGRSFNRLKRRSRRSGRFAWARALARGSCRYICIYFDHIRRWLLQRRASLVLHNQHTMLFHQHGSDRTLRGFDLRRVGLSRCARPCLSCSRRPRRKSSRPGISRAYCKVCRSEFFFFAHRRKRQKKKFSFTYICGLWTKFSSVQSRNHAMLR